MNKEGESLQAILALVCNNKYKPLDPPAPPAPSTAKAGQGRQGRRTRTTSASRSRRTRASSPRRGRASASTTSTTSELELAIAAYARVLDFKDSPYYDKALYKLAWSYLPRRQVPRGDQALRRAGRLLRQEEGGVGRRGLRSARRVGAVPRHQLRREGLERRLDRRRRERPRARREVLSRARARAARARDLRQARRHLLRRDRVLPRHRGLQAHARQVALSTRTTRSCRTASSWRSSASATSATRSRSARSWRATTPRAPSGTSTTATTSRPSTRRTMLAELALVVGGRQPPQGGAGR